MKRWVVLVILLVLLAVVGVCAYFLHWPVLVWALLAILCIVIAATFLWYQSSYLTHSADNGASAADLDNLAALVRDADSKLRNSPRAGAKSLNALPLVYVLGVEDSAKTRTVLQSGLDPELLAGHVFRDQELAPTSLVNVWFTGKAAIVEAGGPLLKEPALWARLVRLTQPGRLKASVSSAQPTRAAVVCVSAESFLDTTAESLQALARLINERLRLLSQILGISLPVYVLFTKLDLLPGFTDFVRNLSPDEINLPLGVTLPHGETGAGLYAERASANVSASFDELVFSISEFRLELLARGGQPAEMAALYEFPRELKKQRTRLVELLVETARPSQLSVNPYLRGFFFSGLRAHVVEEATAGIAASQKPESSPMDAGATRVFSTAGLQKAAQAPQRGSSTRKVWQWVFLPYLFPKLVLEDRAALETSTRSSKVSFLRRFLLASAAAVFLVYFGLLTMSYFNNKALERQVLDAETALPLNATLPVTVGGLHSLDELRKVLVVLETNKKGSPPWSYRWGLYEGDSLYARTCQGYHNRFRTMLLEPAQANILAKLGKLPGQPAEDADYNDIYAPLKAYLITTTNPEKSTVQFLPDVLERYWYKADSNPTADASALVAPQFAYYADELQKGNTCLIDPPGDVRPEVKQAQQYLHRFDAYTIMIAAANRNPKFPEVNFNKQYDPSRAYVVAPHIVPGAFTKDGYAYIQNALQHPFKDEDWVVPGGIAMDPVELNKKYLKEYIDNWTAYLHQASVVGYKSLQDAATKLQGLDSADSRLLALFATVSQNTAVPAAEISSAFQPAQQVVPPASAKRFIAASNQDYVAGLGGIQVAIQGLSPLAANDPSAMAPVSSQTGAAEQKKMALVTSFENGVVSKDAARLLEEPIAHVDLLVKQKPNEAMNGGGKAFCSSLPNAFPFNSSSQQDSNPDALREIFQPNTGTLWVFYKNTLDKVLTQVGAQYVPVPGSPIRLNPAFVQFFNNAAAFSVALFPGGAQQPTLNYTVEETPGADAPEVTLTINQQKLTLQTGPKQLTWNFQPSDNLSLAGPTQATFSGPWALSHFVQLGKPKKEGNKLKLTFPVQFAGKQTNALFEISPPITSDYIGPCISKITQ